MGIYLVKGISAVTPGYVILACASMARAEIEAAELVNILIAEAGYEDTEAGDWISRLGRLWLRRPEWRDECDVSIDHVELLG